MSTINFHRAGCSYGHFQMVAEHGMTPSTAGTGAGCRFDILAKQKAQKGTASRLCRTKSAGPLAIAVFCASEPGSRGKAFITFPMKVAESWCFSNWIRFQTFKNRLWHLFYPEKDFSCRWQHSWCFAWKGDLGKDAQRNRQSQHKKVGDTYTAEGNGKMKRDNPKTQFRSIPKSSERHSSSRKEFSFGQIYLPQHLAWFWFWDYLETETAL